MSDVAAAAAAAVLSKDYLEKMCKFVQVDDFEQQSRRFEPKPIQEHCSDLLKTNYGRDSIAALCNSSECVPNNCSDWNDESLADYWIVARNGEANGERIGCVFNGLAELLEYWQAYIDGDGSELPADYHVLEYHLIEKQDARCFEKISTLLSDLSQFELEMLQEQFM